MQAWSGVLHNERTNSKMVGRDIYTKSEFKEVRRLCKIHLPYNRVLIQLQMTFHWYHSRPWWYQLQYEVARVTRRYKTADLRKRQIEHPPKQSGRINARQLEIPFKSVTAFLYVTQAIKAYRSSRKHHEVYKAKFHPFFRSEKHKHSSSFITLKMPTQFILCHITHISEPLISD